jgi:hypothetical protein
MHVETVNTASSFLTFVLDGGQYVNTWNYKKLGHAVA